MRSPSVPAPTGSTHRVHRLSDLVGAPVRDSGGRWVGRVVDVMVQLGPEYPPVSALVVRAGRRDRSSVAWPAGSRFDGERVVLGVPEGDMSTASVRGPQLPLARDVLDVQVIDVERRRVGRVADVELADAEGEFRAVAVDIGMSAVLSRLGLRWLAQWAGRDAVDWRAMHLAGGASRAVQLDSRAAAVHRLDPEALAEILARLPARGGAEILNTVDEVRAVAALAATHPGLGADLLETLTPERAAVLVAGMDAPAAAAVLREVAPTRRDALVATLPRARARALEAAVGSAPAPPAEPRRRWWHILRGHGRPAP